MKSLRALSTILVLCFANQVAGEPWMASRFAQNCASCHAPGRINLPAKERRCTVSCQGCHTNPNGGGLRNFYGKWTQERWLRSTYSAGYSMNKPKPQPTEQQWYQDKRLKTYLAGLKDPKDAAKVENEGFKLMQTNADLPEREYDRNTPGEKIPFEDMKEAQMRIPQDDPWRLRRERPFNAGVDLRWFYLDTKTNGVHKKGTMPMATDIAASTEPVHRVNLVWEGRFMSDPRQTGVWDSHYTNGAGVRSAYVLVDDMPYNSYAMYGIYRPMFGNYNPDHTTLSAQMTGLDQRATYKATTIGISPGAPFVNFHYIQPFEDRKMAQDRGFVVNAGARMTTLGAFAMLSYWHTSAKDWTLDTLTNRQMSSLTGGFTKWRLTVVGDITRILKETISVRRDSGTVVSLEPRYRMWKENYLKGGWEFSNTAPSLKQGNANSLSVGFSSFILSSTEFEVMYKDSRTTELGVNTNETAVWSQIHLFF